MAVYDVRNDDDDEYDAIVFEDGDYIMSVASQIDCDCTVGVAVRDTSGDFVRVVSKKHALDMIKALEKAIEFGWLE